MLVCTWWMEVLGDWVTDNDNQSFYPTKYDRLYRFSYVIEFNLLLFFRLYLNKFLNGKCN